MALSTTGHLYWLRVVDVSTEMHQQLRHEVRHLVRKRQDAGTQPDDASVSAYQLFRLDSLVLRPLLDPRCAQLLKVTLQLGYQPVLSDDPFHQVISYI